MTDPEKVMPMSEAEAANYLRAHRIEVADDIRRVTEIAELHRATGSPAVKGANPEMLPVPEDGSPALKDLVAETDRKIYKPLLRHW